MQSNFETVLKYVLIDEGGNDDDPQDHGGRTSRGITQRNYDAWCTLNGKPTGDVWHASNEDIRAIYYDQYWKPYCDELPSGVDYLFFDISVNAGRTQAVRQFQKALGVSVDGMFGINTRNAIKSHPDIDSLIHDISEVRRNFYRHLDQFPRYGRGWLRRVDHAENGALALAKNLPFNKPDAGSTAKATKPAKPTVSPENSGTVAGTSGGLLAILHQFKEMLEPYQDAIKYVTYALLGIAVVSMVYMGWSYWKQNKIQKAI